MLIYRKLNFKASKGIPQLYLQFILLSELLLQLDNFVLQALVELFEMVHALGFVAKTLQLLGGSLSTRVSLLKERTICRYS